MHLLVLLFFQSNKCPITLPGARCWICINILQVVEDIFIMLWQRAMYECKKALKIPSYCWVTTPMMVYLLWFSVAHFIVS